MESASPPVSPRVVARILTTQNANVTWGTLLSASRALGSTRSKSCAKVAMAFRDLQMPCLNHECGCLLLARGSCPASSNKVIRRNFPMGKIKYESRLQQSLGNDTPALEDELRFGTHENCAEL